MPVKIDYHLQKKNNTLFDIKCERLDWYGTENDIAMDTGRKKKKG